GHAACAACARPVRPRDATCGCPTHRQPHAARALRGLDAAPAGGSAPALHQSPRRCCPATCPQVLDLPTSSGFAHAGRGYPGGFTDRALCHSVSTAIIRVDDFDLYSVGILEVDRVVVWGVIRVGFRAAIHGSIWRGLQEVAD